MSLIPKQSLSPSFENEERLPLPHAKSKIPKTNEYQRRRTFLANHGVLKAFQLLKTLLNVTISFFLIYFVVPYRSTILLHFKKVYFWLTLIVIIYCAIYIYRKYLLTPDVYLVNSCVYKPPLSTKLSRDEFGDKLENYFKDDVESIKFQRRILDLSGIGDSTHMPTSFFNGQFNYDSIMQEATQIMFSLAEDIFLDIPLKPVDIDTVIVTSNFSPEPGLGEILAKELNMLPSVKVFTLSGLGCSGGLSSIDLAQNLLKSGSSKRILLVSTRNITNSFYFGSNRSMLIPNCLFRMNGAAQILSNQLKDRKFAKYALLHSVRTLDTKGINPSAIREQLDVDGKLGLYLSKNLLQSSVRVVRRNLQFLAPNIIRMRDQFKFSIGYYSRKLPFFGELFKKPVEWPDFTTNIDHFCIHCGGKGVLELIQAKLRLSKSLMEPTMKSLWNYGNTSVASVWYTLDFIEKNVGVECREKIMQIAYGAGFECCTLVWQKITDDFTRSLERNRNSIVG
eukprot:TRINITY_DN2475_c0_g6_i1.p1 TRINITY_DN2475_c0_g6~~TRINITY_DN2475_c0_g6_i1.p1  ORF type:complete len:507 (-),score=87.93 TRINITY_DN2475_c0_g6_i1:56-1576(-)